MGSPLPPPSASLHPLRPHPPPPPPYAVPPAPLRPASSPPRRASSQHAARAAATLRSWHPRTTAGTSSHHPLPSRYPYNALRCVSTLTRPLQLLICPIDAQKWCVKEVLNLAGPSER